MSWLLRWFAILGSAAFLKPFLARVLVLLGVGVVTYAGMGALLDGAKDAIATNYSGIPADIVAVLSIAKFDRAINVILSALSARLIVQGLTSSGALKQVLWRPGQQGSLFP